MVLRGGSEIGKFRYVGPTTALEETEQGTGRAGQDPLLGEARFGHQTLAMFEVADTEGDMGVGTEGEVGSQISRRFDDGTAVIFTARPGVDKGGVVDLQRDPVLCGGPYYGLDVDGKGGVARVAYHVDPAALDGVDHRLGVGRLVARGKHGLVEAGHDHVEAGFVAFGKVYLPVQILDVGFDAAQYADPVDDSWQYMQVDEVPEVGSIGHVGTMIRGGKQLDPFGLGDRQVVVDGAVGVGAGDRVGMGVDCVFHGVPLDIQERQHSK